MSKSAIKHDAGKPDMATAVLLVPEVALEAEGAAMLNGVGEYGKDNWKNGMEWSRYLAALMRHVRKWGDGEDIDPKSGVHHLGHARACLGIIMGMQALGVGIDDRPK